MLGLIAFEYKINVSDFIFCVPSMVQCKISKYYNVFRILWKGNLINLEFVKIWSNSKCIDKRKVSSPTATSLRHPKNILHYIHFIKKHIFIEFLIKQLKIIQTHYIHFIMYSFYMHFFPCSFIYLNSSNSGNNEVGQCC